MASQKVDEYETKWSHKLSASPASQTPCSFRNAREYAQALRPWLWQYQNCVMHWMSANLSLQTQALSLFSGSFASNNFFSPASNNSFFFSPASSSNRFFFTPASNSSLSHRPDPYASRRPLNENVPITRSPQQQTTGHNAPNLRGAVRKIPTFWRRVAAELIDFTFLFYIKMIVSLFLVTELNLDHISLINGDDLLETFTEMNYDRAFAITFDVIALEVINRVLITIFETMCLYRSMGARGALGATPGKKLMGLKVVSCDSIQCLGNGQVFVSPAGSINFKNALLRSVIKNFTIAFFLPACLTIFFFKHNRAAYDVMAHTIVVEDL